MRLRLRHPLQCLHFKCSSFNNAQLTSAWWRYKNSSWHGKPTRKQFRCWGAISIYKKTIIRLVIWTQPSLKIFLLNTSLLVAWRTCCETITQRTKYTPAGRKYYITSTWHTLIRRSLTWPKPLTVLCISFTQEYDNFSFNTGTLAFVIRRQITRVYQRTYPPTEHSLFLRLRWNPSSTVSGLAGVIADKVVLRNMGKSPTEDNLWRVMRVEYLVSVWIFESGYKHL